LIQKDEFNRESWLAKGWKRGAFVDLKRHGELLSSLPKKLAAHVETLDQAFLIPVLYDCALVDERFDAEPWAQVVVCWPCVENADFCYGKNPRRYHFPVFIDDQKTHLEVNALSFCQLDREELLTFDPNTEIDWPNLGLDQLLNWISERIRQPTFPDAWNNRLKKKEKNFKRLWKKDSFVNSCSGVYFSIEPSVEIAEHEKYRVRAFITTHLEGRALRDFMKDHESELVGKLADILRSTSNVDVGQVDLINEGQFTKSMERQYLRWQLEHYSYKEEGVAPLPAELEILRH